MNCADCGRETTFIYPDEPYCKSCLTARYIMAEERHDEEMEVDDDE